MRLPRVRFTVRRPVVTVFVVATMLAIAVGLQRRKVRFAWLFSYHIGLAGPSLILELAPDYAIFETAKGRWYYELAMKYAEAAKRPWLPVPPDPPEPD